jgi:hypothetical protein
MWHGYCYCILRPPPRWSACRAVRQREMTSNHNRPNPTAADVAHQESGGSPTDAWDVRGCVFGLRALEPGFERFVFAPRPTALEWARAVVPTPHGNVLASWQFKDNVLEATLAVPGGTTALALIPVAALGHREVSVNGRVLWPTGAPEGVAGVSCGREENGCVALDLQGGQTYRFRSR